MIGDPRHDYVTNMRTGFIETVKVVTY
jgi:hypothetical protein